MILIFPGEDQFLSDMLQLSPVGLGSGLSHLFSGVGGLPTSSSYCHILVGRTDGHRERLVQVGLVCGDGDVDVHGCQDTPTHCPVTLQTRQTLERTKTPQF